MAPSSSSALFCDSPSQDTSISHHLMHHTPTTVSQAQVSPSLLLLGTSLPRQSSSDDHLSHAVRQPSSAPSISAVAASSSSSSSSASPRSAHTMENASNLPSSPSSSIALLQQQLLMASSSLSPSSAPPSPLNDQAIKQTSIISINAGQSTSSPSDVRKGPQALPPEVWANVAQYLHAMGTATAQQSLFSLCLLRLDISAAVIEWLWRAPVVDGFRQTERFLKGIHLNIEIVKKLAAEDVVASTTPITTSAPFEFPRPRASLTARTSVTSQTCSRTSVAAGASKTATMTASRLRTYASLIVSLERTARNPDGWLERLLPYAKNILYPPQAFWTEMLLDMDADAIEKVLGDGFLRKASLSSLALSVPNTLSVMTPSAVSGFGSSKIVGNASTLASLALTFSNREKLLILSNILEKRAEAEAAAAASAARELEARSRATSEMTSSSDGGWAGSRRVTSAVESSPSSSSSSSSASFWSAPLPRGPGRLASSPDSAPAGGSKTWGGFFDSGPTPPPPRRTESPTPFQSSTSSYSTWPTRSPSSASSSSSSSSYSRRTRGKEEDPVLAESTTPERILNCLLPTDKKLGGLFAHFTDLKRLVFYERCVTAAADAVLRVAVLNCGMQLRQIALMGSAFTKSPEGTSGGSNGGGIRFTRLSFQSIWWGCPNLEELRVERVDLSSGREAGGGQGGSVGSGGSMDWCSGSRSSPLARPLIHVRPKLRRITIRDCVTPEAALLAELLPLVPNLESLDLGNLTLSHPTQSWRTLWQTCLELSVFSKLPQSLKHLRVSWSPPCGVPLPVDTLTVLARRSPRLIDLQLEGMARLPPLDAIAGSVVSTGSGNSSLPGSTGSLASSTGSSASNPTLSSVPSYKLSGATGVGHGGPVSVSSSLNFRNTPPGSPNLAMSRSHSQLMMAKHNNPLAMALAGGSSASNGANNASGQQQYVARSVAPSSYHPSPPSSPKLGLRHATAAPGSPKVTPRPLLQSSALGGSHGSLLGLVSGSMISHTGSQSNPQLTQKTSPTSPLGSAHAPVVPSPLASASSATAAPIVPLPLTAYPRPILHLRTLDLRFTSFLTDATLHTIAASGLATTLRHFAFRPEQGGGFTDVGLNTIATHLTRLQTLIVVPNDPVGANNIAASTVSSPHGSMHQLAGSTSSPSKCSEIGLSHIVENLVQLRNFLPPVFANGTATLAAVAAVAAALAQNKNGMTASPFNSPPSLSPPQSPSPERIVSPSSGTAPVSASASAMKVRALLGRLRRRGCRVWEPLEFMAACVGSAGSAGSPLGACAGGAATGDAQPMEVGAFEWGWGCLDEDGDGDGPSATVVERGRA